MEQGQDAADRLHLVPATTMASLVVFKDDRLWRVVPVTQTDMVVGRRETCDVVLDHSSVSRVHLRIGHSGPLCVASDEGSTNGIVVNGKVVKKASLGHGDVIQVGIFKLHFHDEPAGNGLPDTTMAFSPQELARIQDSYRRLEALFMLSTDFSTLVNTAELLEKMIDCLVDAFHADRGFVLLHDAKTGRLKPAIARKIESKDLSASISLTVAQWVAQTRKPVLITDMEAESQFKESPSIQKGDIRSIICTPALKGEKVVGVLYLDSQLKTRRFLPEDLRLLDTFSRQAGLLIETTQEREQLRRDILCLKAIQHTQAVESGDFAGIVGRSPAMAAVVRQAQAAARQDVTTLILGESGTGKELLAKAIHQSSHRRDRPMVAVNCMALSRDVIESELFGHEKGAFTGAAERRIGRFELAEGGTIFLDEIGDLAPAIQVKLLRVLQERQIERVGGTKPVDIDVRLVCATNCDLEAQVAQGRFREDLFYRINVLSLKLPSLRERREDIGLLVEHFVTHFRKTLGRGIASVAPDAMNALVGYHWPGNIRELRNVIERAFVLETGDVLSLESLPFNLLKAAGQTPVAVGQAPAPSYPRQYTKARMSFERDFLMGALRRSKGNVTSTAQEVALPRKTLYRKLEQLKIDLREFNQAQELTEKHMILEALKKHKGSITAVSNELGIPRTSIYRKLTQYGIDLKDFSD